jgi:hypothetical protein
VRGSSDPVFLVDQLAASAAAALILLGATMIAGYALASTGNPSLPTPAGIGAARPPAATAPRAWDQGALCSLALFPTSNGVRAIPWLDSQSVPQFQSSGRRLL